MARLEVADINPEDPPVIVAKEPLHAMLQVEGRAVPDSVPGVERAQTKDVHGPLVRAHGADDLGVDARLEDEQLLTRQLRGPLAPLERLKSIVGLEVGVAELVHPARLRRPIEDGQKEGDPKQEVRRDLLDVARVQTREARHVAVRLHVPDAAVDHPARGPARGGPQIPLIEDGHAEAPEGGVARDPRTVDAGTDDDQIELGHVGLSRMWTSSSWA